MKENHNNLSGQKTVNKDDQKGSLRTVQLYDAVFWSSSKLLKEYLPFLVNEAFGEAFSKNAAVTFKSAKEVVSQNGDIAKTEYVDALFSIEEMLHSHSSVDIHFECEVYGTKSIYVRIAKYVSGYAFENAVETSHGAKIIIPRSAVIFLRRTSKNISRFIMTIECPAGEMSYHVPIIRIKDYTLDSLFNKHLLILLPFYPFIFTEKELKQMNNDIEGRQIQELIENLDQRLRVMVKQNELTDHQRVSTLDNLLMVLEKVAIKYKNIRKAANDMRKIKIIKTEVDIAFETLDNLNQQYKIKSQELETTNQQLETANQQLETVNQQLETTSQQLETTSQQLETTSLQLETTSLQLETTSLQLETTSLQLETTSLQLESKDRQLDAQKRENTLLREELNKLKELLKKNNIALL